MESTGELAWFRSEVLRSIVRPRSFARSLAREHFGLAGVLVVVGAGIALSLTIDAVVLAAKGLSPWTFVSRLIFESLLLGARLAVSVAVIAFVVFLGTRVTRQNELTLDQCFNAVAFAFAPLIVAPLVALVAVFAPNLLITVGAVLLVIGLRALAGLGLNLRAMLPLPVAALAFVLALASGAIVLGDQVSRVRMTAYAIAPQLAPPLAATPAQGKRYDLQNASVTVPEEWAYSVRGVPGEVAHFETASATLNVVSSRPEDLATMDSFADAVARGERLGFSATRNERSVERINGSVAVDDRSDGTYEGRHIAIRQFAIALRTSGGALQFRFFDPPDVDAAFAQAAAIAATWQLGAPPP
ncbi:MAG: YIP1 family protein [Chloroflexota bacterium]|nr:YIP1 family protein [Chloroflexota bacterium]